MLHSLIAKGGALFAILTKRAEMFTGGFVFDDFAGPLHIDVFD